MVFNSRKRRLLRAMFVASIFAGCLLIFRRWNSKLSSQYVTVIGSDRSSDLVYNERKTRKQDLIIVTKRLVINKKQENEKKEKKQPEEKQTETQKKRTSVSSDIIKKPNVTWIHHHWTPSLRGFLNVHVWLDWCGSTVNDLRRNIHFPKYPDVRLKTKLFHLSHDAHNYGQRVFGFLHPPKTGRYTFAISSDDSSELWLSFDEEPKNARLIAWVGNLSDPLWQGVVGEGDFAKYKSQISTEIYLIRNQRYFVEALHKQSSSNDHLLVAWKIPHRANFSHVTRGRISQYIHPHELHNLDVTRYARHIPLTPAVLQKPLTLWKLSDQIPVSNQNFKDQLLSSNNEHLYRREDDPTGKRDRKDKHIFQRLKNIKGLSFNFPQSVAPVMYARCKYEPSYRVDFNVSRYEGVYLIHETALYPDDRTHLKHVENYKPCYEMRAVDSHGGLLTSVGENWEREEDMETTEETGTSDHIVEVDYRALHGEHSELNRNFSRKERFIKRRILGVSDRSPGDETNRTKYEHMTHGTTRLGMTSRFHGNNLQGDTVVVEVEGNSSVVSKRNSRRKIEPGREFNSVEKSVITAGSSFKTSRGSTVAPEKSFKKENGKRTIGLKRRTSEVNIGEQRIVGDNRDRLEASNVKHLDNKDLESKVGVNVPVGNTDKKRIVGVNVPMGNIDKKRIVIDNYGSQRIKRYVSDQEVLPGQIRDNDRLDRLYQHSPNKRNSQAKNESKKLPSRASSENKIQIWHRLKEKRQEHENEANKRRVLSKLDDVRNKIIKNKANEFHIGGNNSFPRQKSFVYHRKRFKPSYNVFVEESSPLAVTFRKLQETGQWTEIQAYAKRNGLLLTRKTWSYVTWKYLRYVKPKKPHDKLVEFIYKQNPSICRTDGNILLNEEVAKSVVNKYMGDLRQHYGSEIYLKRIVNVEENHDVIKGDRYLIELDLGLNGKKETVRVSDYVFLPLGEKSFCSPQDFVWRKNVTVHVIVPVKDQGKWVQHFINDMAELYETTQDPNINVIIVDFNSTDIDIEEALKRSALKRYRFLKVNGSFQRALGVQIGADVVEDPDDIIFTCDLHLDIPNNMIEIIRKHCIQGKMAFSPMVLRLECGFTPSLPYGEWETMGYGLFAIYKSDFDRIGGMNIDEFKTKWGGEDWEMVDRFLQKQMEIERFRVANFYHFFHSKQGMWGSYGFEDNVSGDLGDSILEDDVVPVYDASANHATHYSYNQPLMPEY